MKNKLIELFGITSLTSALLVGCADKTVDCLKPEDIDNTPGRITKAHIATCKLNDTVTVAHQFPYDNLREAFAAAYEQVDRTDADEAFVYCFNEDNEVISFYMRDEEENNDGKVEIARVIDKDPSFLWKALKIEGVFIEIKP